MLSHNHESKEETALWKIVNVDNLTVEGAVVDMVCMCRYLFVLVAVFSLANADI